MATPTAKPDKPDTRFTFVEMLFALTVAQIAIQVADLVKGGFDWGDAAPYAHLVLATGLIATSWVCWSQSSAPGNQTDARTIFSLPFVLLLFDVWLVIIYFIIVMGVESEKGPNGQIKASAENETFWLLVTYVGYALWDVFTKWVMPCQNAWTSLWSGASAWRYLERGWASLACAFLAWTCYALLSGATEPLRVVLTDGALLSLIFLFRAMKQWSRIREPTHEAGKTQEEIDAERRERQKIRRIGRAWTFVVGAAFLVFLVSALWSS